MGRDAAGADPSPEAPVAAASPASGPPLRLVIVGAGSIGLTFAAALARSGHLVTVLGRPASAEALLNRGSIEVSGQLAFTVPVAAPPAHPARVAVIGQPGDLGPRTPYCSPPRAKTYLSRSQK